MELSRQAKRQIEITKNIYDYDIEKGIVTIPLHYETAEDIVNTTLGCKTSPAIKDEVVDYLQDIIETVPKGFEISFSLTVDDYMGYESQDILDALLGYIEHWYYNNKDANKSRNMIAVSFFVVGIILLVIQIVSAKEFWFSPENTASYSIIDNFLSIGPWVFIWEAAAIFFLTYENESTFYKKDIKRLYELIFKSPSGNILCSADKKTIYKNWIVYTKLENFARKFVLFFSLVVLFIITTYFYDELMMIKQHSLLQIVLDGVCMLFILLTIICNVSTYREGGFFRKLAIPASILATISYILLLIVIVPHIRVQGIVIISVMIVTLFINTLCLIYLNKKNKYRKK